MVFLSGVMLGVWVSIFSSSWLGAWGGMELNMLCFVPMISDTSKFSKEGAMKYFLIQTFGSYLMLFSGLFSIEKSSEFSLMLGLALILKSGLSPLHYWYPVVAEEMEWAQYFLLSTLQKVSPLTLMFYSVGGFWSVLLHLSVVSGGVFGSVGSFNEPSLRKFLAYSSVHHFSWLVVPLLEGSSIWVLYLMIYSIIKMVMVWNLMYAGVYHMSQMYSLKNLFLSKVSMMLNFFSFGGVPPTLGFVPKWLILWEVHSLSSLICICVLLFTSVIMLYTYTRFCIVLAIVSKHGATKTFNFKEDWVGVVGLLFNVTGLYFSGSLMGSFLQ